MYATTGPGNKSQTRQTSRYYVIHSAQLSYAYIRGGVELQRVNATEQTARQPEHIQEDDVAHNVFRFPHVEQENCGEEQNEENRREGFRYANQH